MTQQTTIPLSKLVHSSQNVRKTGGQSIDDLAASIFAHGLLQNLTVTKGKGGKHEVVAGGRRHRALQKLAKEKKIDADYPVPVNVVDANRAAEASLAENVVREAMHPADQFDAFQVLSNDGKSATDIAAAFGVSDLIVKQRLKLAKVAPSLVAEYRAGAMDLETLQAFTLTDDQAAQLRIWKNADGWQRSARHIRDVIAKDEVNFARSSLAKLVGIDAYIAAGGKVRQDLFGENSYLDDAELLDRLANVELERFAAALRAEGWKWVKIETDGADTWKYAKRRPKNRPTTVEEDRELASLREKAAQLRVRLDGDDETDDGEDLWAKIEVLEARVAEVLSGLASWSKKTLSEAGAIVELLGSGVVTIHRGLVTQADERQVVRASEAKKKGEPIPTGPELSDAMTLRLTAHRTAVIQSLLCGNQIVMLAVLAHALIKETFGDGFELFEPPG